VKLDELKRLADEATPGPWEHMHYSVWVAEGGGDKIKTDDGRLGVKGEVCTTFTTTAMKQNFPFIVASRTAVPELVRRLMRLRELDAMEELTPREEQERYELIWSDLP